MWEPRGRDFLHGDCTLHPNVGKTKASQAKKPRPISAKLQTPAMLTGVPIAGYSSLATNLAYSASVIRLSNWLRVVGLIRIIQPSP